MTHKISIKASSTHFISHFCVGRQKTTNVQGKNHEIFIGKTIISPWTILDILAQILERCKNIPTCQGF